MKERLRLLMVEDSDDDAELLLQELRRTGFAVEHRQVQTANDMRAALTEQIWDVVLSDYSMPQFSAPAALAVLEETGIDLPFVVVSGTIGEEVAVDTLRAGAHDFIVKGRLARLAPAIRRELADAQTRRERRHAIGRVEESERRLSEIFNHIAVGVIQLDLDARILSSNRRFADLVGRRIDEMDSLRLHDLAHGDDLHDLAAKLAQLRHGERDLGIEKRFVGAGDKVVWLNITITVVADRPDHAPYAVAIVQDVTARKRAEDELREAIIARDEFLSIASHELKTPITSLSLAVASGLDLVRSRRYVAVPPEKLESKLETAARQVDRLTMLVDNLLDVTRITSGRLRLTRGRIDLGALFRDVAARVRESLRQTGSQLSIHGDETVVGYWDALGIEAVVGNLLSNAAKFGLGKPIDVTIERDGKLARLVVTDHGIGIGHAEQKRIFERFERAVPAQHYGGFGVGLWIARHMVEAHGGTIRVVSEKATGSTFTVELPLGEERTAP